MLGHSFPTCVFFASSFSFFNGEVSLRTLIPLFMPRSVHSGSASLDDCGWMFPKLHVSSFLDRFPHYAWTAAWSAHPSFVGSRVYACLGGNDWVFLCATAVTREGWGEQTPQKESTHTVKWRRKFSCHSCRYSNSEPFNQESGALTGLQAVPASWSLRPQSHWQGLRSQEVREEEGYPILSPPE